ncbi:MAG: fatty acid desaturase [Pirellulaceae bacterium]
MRSEQSKWYRSLDAETKAAIRELHRIKPLWNLTPFVFALAWVGFGFLIMSDAHWSLRLVGYFGIGVIIHAYFSLMHEGMHGNFFRNRRWDRWYGFLVGLPTLFPVSEYATNHLLHHKHTRTEKDPDELMYLARSKSMQSFIFYAMYFVGTYFYLLHIPYVVYTRGTNRQRIRAALERLLIFALLCGLSAAAWVFGFVDVLFHCWFLPILVTTVLASIRIGGEHQMTDADHPLRQARTVTSNVFCSFCNVHLNYHLEHHLFPRIPWYNLPKLHRVLLPEYKRHGASVYRSYLWFLWDAFRIGIHGRAPDRASVLASARERVQEA